MFPLDDVGSCKFLYLFGIRLFCVVSSALLSINLIGYHLHHCLINILYIFLFISGSTLIPTMQGVDMTSTLVTMHRVCSIVIRPIQIGS